MSVVHIHLTVQSMPSGKWVGTIRREGQGIPYGLTRGFGDRRDAERWLVENAKTELTVDGSGEDAAA